MPHYAEMFDKIVTIDPEIKGHKNMGQLRSNCPFAPTGAFAEKQIISLLFTYFASSNYISKKILRLHNEI